VVIDCRAEVFQIAAGSTWAAAGFHVFSAAMGIRFDQHHTAEEIVQAANAIREFRNVDLLSFALKINALAMGMIDR
jgi:hypothetical protein